MNEHYGEFFLFLSFRPFFKGNVQFVPIPSSPFVILIPVVGSNASIDGIQSLFEFRGTVFDASDECG